MTTLVDVNALAAEVAGLKKLHADNDRALGRLSRLIKERELCLLEARGEGNGYDARWLRAALSSNHKECDRVLAQQYPDGDTARIFAARWGEPVDAPAGYDAEAHATSAGLVLADAADDEARAAHGS